MTIKIQQIIDAQIDGGEFVSLNNSLGLDSPLPAEITDPADLIGHLNLIHRRRIHVIGKEEIAFIDRLESGRRRNLELDLVAAKPPAIILADHLQAPTSLKALCNQSGIPILGTPLPAAKVIDRVRNFLIRALASTTSKHGVLMDVLGLGVMISGESGLGKSELALELISRGHGLVADDVIELIQLGPHSLEGRCPPLLQNMLEVRGLGMLDIRTIFGEAAVRRRIKLKLIVQLVKRSAMDTEYERLPLQNLTESILDVDVPKVVIPVAAGRNLAVLTEAAVRNTILKTRGIDSTLDFIERQNQLIANDNQGTDL
jgi:HPr kinase/phosphorylase